MTEIAYPEVVTAFINLATSTLSASVRVVRGYDISEDPGDVLCVGAPNLSDVDALSAGNFTQEQIGHGAAGVVRETGSLNACVVAWNGDSSDEGSAAAQSTAFGYLATLAAAVRANRSLGVTTFSLAVQTVTATGDVAEDKVNGATCAVSFTVNYIAQLEH